jgi:eukaryotic-like serine/threonine-protein kinase
MQNVDIPPVSSGRAPIRLGRYEIMCKLGAGGMADVFLAHQPGPFSAGKLVVIKQLRPGVIADDQVVQMFADESRIAVRLNHPNVIHTYEVVAEEGQFYLILEFLDGKSLHQVLGRVKREQMPLSLHIWMLIQVLAGLQYAHELKDFDGTPLGIVHRDVSPANVFVTYEGEVKLLDFGIAKSTAASCATREGIIKGKLGYAAPEQCLCKATDCRTDLFAVGVMLWEAIAGRKRALGETDASTYQARVQGTELRIEQVCPKTPRELINICNLALARQPDQRYQSAFEFRQALERYLQSVGWDEGPEHLRGFMHEQFQEDIADMRQRIDSYLNSSRPMSGPAPAMTGQMTGMTGQMTGMTGMTGQMTGMTGQLSTSLSGRIEGTGLRNSTALSSIGPVLVAWYKRPLPMGGVVLAALGLVGTVYAVRGSAPAALVPPAASVAAVAVPVVPAAAHLNQDARPTQTTERVTVFLAATPSSAVIELDGRRVSNPYRATHGQDSASHHLRVSLAGYESLEQELQFVRDVDVTVVLNRSQAQSAAPVVRRASVSRASAVATPVSSPVPSQASAPASPKASPLVEAAPQPGEDMRSNISRVKAREIEEMDPYKR